MKEIAVYGKGGIGKSTLTGNISAALSLSGKKVLQIGCDPKHDSTRLLLGGKEITTVLDYIRSTGPNDYCKADILFEGFRNIGCIEAGGPKPGVGCAGRGIITVFEILEQFKIKQQYDIIIYDVLGDVVCGGFAVPIRREYADTIFLVTSGEYMSLYAANNILRGVKNYDGEKCRVAGILYNKRNLEGEDERVMAFAKAVNLPICATFPRSDDFAKAERLNHTVVEGKDCPIKDSFIQLAKEMTEGMTLHEAKPLTDRELEKAVLGICKEPVYENPSCKESIFEEEESVQTEEVELSNPNRYLSKNMIRNEPLHGCAFCGATSMCVHIKDAVILTHGPKSCTYIAYQSISSAGRRRLFERGALLPVQIAPNLISTEMGEIEMVFGGMDKLKERVLEVQKQSPKAIIVISTCPSGIIGDDIEQIKTFAKSDMPIITIKADGNLTGDYLQGMLMCYTETARQIIKKDVKTIPNTVNVVFEKVVAKNTNRNFEMMQSFLEEMGVTVNCRFLCETTFEQLENFCSAELNLLAHKDYTGQILQNFFSKEYDCNFYESAFPIGFLETKNWIKGVANFFKKPYVGEAIISQNEAVYESRINALKPQLEGKKLMIITYNHELDWILKSALDVNMEIINISILNFSQDEGFRSHLGIEFPVQENYDPANRQEDLIKYKPDILLSNYESSLAYENCVADTIPMCPDVGFFSGLNLLERWAKLLQMDLQGDWKKDEKLFIKYYS